MPLFDSWREDNRSLEENEMSSIEGKRLNDVVSLSDLQLKRSDDYYSQVQGQMAITGKKKTYFVVWTNVGNLLLK